MNDLPLPPANPEREPSAPSAGTCAHIRLHLGFVGNVKLYVCDACRAKFFPPKPFEITVRMGTCNAGPAEAEPTPDREPSAPSAGAGPNIDEARWLLQAISLHLSDRLHEARTPNRNAISSVWDAVLCHLMTQDEKVLCAQIILEVAEQYKSAFGKPAEAEPHAGGEE